MPIADALADAETLRRFCDDNLYSADFPLFSSYPLIAIWKCGSSGWTVRSINRGREFDARSRAETQARAAFRAVPGLRGTDADEKALHGALCLRSEWLNAPCECDRA